MSEELLKVEPHGSVDLKPRRVRGRALFIVFTIMLLLLLLLFSASRKLTLIHILFKYALSFLMGSIFERISFLKWSLESLVLISNKLNFIPTSCQKETGLFFNCNFFFLLKIEIFLLF